MGDLTQAAAAHRVHRHRKQVAVLDRRGLQPLEHVGQLGRVAGMHVAPPAPVPDDVADVAAAREDCVGSRRRAIPCGGPRSPYATDSLIAPHAGGVVVAAGGLQHRTLGSELIESARKHLDNAEPAAAAIQLKHALDRQPGSAPARLLLGKALMAQGDAAGAILELQRARDGGVAAEQVVLELARAHAMAGQRGQAKALLEDAPLTGAEAKA